MHNAHLPTHGGLFVLITTREVRSGCWHAFVPPIYLPNTTTHVIDVLVDHLPCVCEGILHFMFVFLKDKFTLVSYELIVVTFHFIIVIAILLFRRLVFIIFDVITHKNHVVIAKRKQIHLI